MLNYTAIILYIIPSAYFLAKFLGYLASFKEPQRFGKSSTVPALTIWNNQESILFWRASPWLVPILDFLPFGWGHWIRYVATDCSWAHKGKLPREELGSDVYWLLGPGQMTLVVGDADVCSDIVHRWKDFPKPVKLYVALDVFGKNVVSSEGAQWQQHRKITAPIFNEGSNSLVFQETLEQGKGMLACFTHGADGKVPISGLGPDIEDLRYWTMTATLNVLSGAVFGMKIPWPTHSVALPLAKDTRGSKDRKMTFQQSLEAITNYVPFIILFNPFMLRNSPFKIMRDMQRASDEFLACMRQLIAKYHHLENASTQRDDFVSSIIRAGEIDERMALSESETIGNVFVFLLAGHETTATTLHTSLILLGMYPSIRQNVQEEIDSICATKALGEDPTYDDYPKMRNIMALMLETLRVYQPVTILPKSTSTPQILHYRGKEIYLPANSYVSLDTVAIHCNPEYWGKDADVFRPSRWLMPSTYIPGANSINQSPAHANLFCPRKGTFLGFSGGFRACLGKKFAQVEFCTLLFLLLRHWSIELVPDSGDTWDQTLRKTEAKLQDRTTGLSLRMNGKVKVRFARREKEPFPIP